MKKCSWCKRPENERPLEVVKAMWQIPTGQLEVRMHLCQECQGED